MFEQSYNSFTNSMNMYSLKKFCFNSLVVRRPCFMFRKYWFLILAVAVFLLGSKGVFADVVIKVRALNPLETQEIAVVKYPLPKEVSQEHILRKNITYSKDHSQDEEPPKSDFQISFDESEGSYYIDDTISIGPKEVITLEVHVKDVWMIEKTRIEGLKKDVDNLLGAWEEQLEALKESAQGGEEDVEIKEFALMMKGEILKKLDEIVQRQDKTSIVKTGVQRHIEAFEDNMEDLRQVQQDIVLLANLIQLDSQEDEVESEGEEVLPSSEEKQIEESGAIKEESIEQNNITLEEIDAAIGDQIVMEEVGLRKDQRVVEDAMK